VQESSGFTEKADAANLLKQRIGEVAAGRRGGPERATIADLCQLVIEDNRLRRLRDAAHVEWRYRKHIEPRLGKLPVSRFGAAQVRQYVAARRVEGASDATINRELAIVRRGLQLGYEAEPPLVHRPPVIRKLEERNVRQGFIEQDQYETLLEELPLSLKALLVCGFHTGARKSELRLLQWPQVDFEAGLIRLSGESTKNKQPRTLPVYGDMRHWLDRQRETCPAGCPWVFHGARGRPVDNHLPGWRDACARAGLPGLLFHDLRRSAVRNLEREGIPRHVAMTISGHKTEAVYRRYDIVAERDVVAAGKRLEEAARRRKLERAAPLVRVK
jgi:integrase